MRLYVNETEIDALNVRLLVKDYYPKTLTVAARFMSASYSAKSFRRIANVQRAVNENEVHK